MIIATIERDRVTIKGGVWQYDLGQSIAIMRTDLDLSDAEMQWVYSALPAGTTSDNRNFAEITEPGEGEEPDTVIGYSCPIPDAALTVKAEVKGYIYKQGETGEAETIAVVSINLRERPAPADYVSADNTVTLTVLIDARIALALPEAVESEVESQLPGAIAEANLVPYTGATKEVDLNGQNLSGINRLTSETCTTNQDKTVAFGHNNHNTGLYGAINGGINNTNSGKNGTVGGGIYNLNSAENGTVGGGINNINSAENGTVGGGINNDNSGKNGTVGGGINNFNSGENGTVGGGINNYNSGDSAFLHGLFLYNAEAFATMFGKYATMPNGGIFAIGNGTGIDALEKIGIWLDKSGNFYVGNMDRYGAGGFNLKLLTDVEGSLHYNGNIVDVQPIIVDTFDELPVTAANGTDATVRLIEQQMTFDTVDIDKTGLYLIGAAMPQVYFNPVISKPNFTELGIPSGQLNTGFTTVYGRVAPLTASDRNWHATTSVDKYDMIYYPAGDSNPEAITVKKWIGATGRIEYVYLFDDPGQTEELFVQGWNKALTWDGEDALTYEGIDEMPPLLLVTCTYFGTGAAGAAAQQYFGSVINTQPYKYRKFIRDNGEWIPTDTTGETLVNGVDGATPTIGTNGNWYINGSDTGVLADVNEIDLSGYLAGTYPAEPGENDFLNADGTFKEVASIPTMTEYATALTLNNANYWTTTASIQFTLPTPVAGKVNTFDLDLTVANAEHAITWSAAVEWAGAVAHVFGAGHHIVSGQYSPVSSKWVLVASSVGVTA